MTGFGASYVIASLAARVQGVGAVGFAVVLGALALITLRRPRRRALSSQEDERVPQAPQRLEEKS